MVTGHESMEDRCLGNMHFTPLITDHWPLTTDQ